jgi:hypothetical protein
LPSRRRNSAQPAAARDHATGHRVLSSARIHVNGARHVRAVASDRDIGVAWLECTPITTEFVVETADEVVYGLKEHVHGACIGNVDVVRLPASPKPVRLARCRGTREGDCPPVG